LTASIHYRQAAKPDYEAIQTAVDLSVASAGGLFRVTTGRKVFEVVPHTSWHKGTAARWINNQIGEEDLLTIYLGDDITDENAFCALPDAITINVGDMPITSARFQLPDPSAVHEFLLWLAIQETSRSVQHAEG
jgi:trehalose-phosphatase